MFYVIIQRAYQIVKYLTKPKQRASTNIQNKDGNCINDKNGVIIKWTQYYSELYNFNNDKDTSILNATEPTDNDNYPILRSEVVSAIHSLKSGKSPVVDNIIGELLKSGGENMISVITKVCNKIWNSGDWPMVWTQSLIICIHKKGNIQKCENYRTISLISHMSKIMLKVILRRLQPIAEELLSKKQAYFRAGRSTNEQIFNLRIIQEKYTEYQKQLYHIFIDFKKSFDRIWHAALWDTMKRFNINVRLIKVIQRLY